MIMQRGAHIALTSLANALVADSGIARAARLGEFLIKADQLL